MINVGLKRACSLEQSELMSPKYRALHRVMGRSPHELRSFSGGRITERYSVFLSISALVALVKKRRVFMLP